MGLIGSLKWGIGLDFSDLDRDVSSAADRVSSIGLTSPEITPNLKPAEGQGAGAGVGAVGAGAVAAMARLGPQLQSALAAGLAPLSQIGTRISSQLDVVGGTVVTLARRIDGAMKFDGSIAAAKKLQSAIQSATAAARATAEADMGRVEKAILKIGPVASQAVGGFVVFRQVSGWLGNLGDVSKRSLDQLKKIDSLKLSAPAAGAKALGTAFNAVDAPVKKVTASVQGLGREIAAALGVFGLVAGAVTFIGSGVKAAMDLNETVSKTKEVFGDATSSVTAQADEMAKAYGLPKGPLLDAASSIGLIGKGAKQSDAEAAAMANTLSRLAADASSFYNVPLDASLEKVRAGLVGESEPLRAFGVLLSEDAVKQEALRLGLVKSAKDLDERSKVAARASLIEKGLATASGDLARTQDSAANQFRKAGGGVQNFAASIGELLMPAVQSGIGAFNEFLATVIEVFEQNKPLISSWVDRIKGGIDLVGLALRNLGTFWQIAQLKAAESVANVVAVFETLPANLKIIGEYVANNWSKLVLDGLAAVGTGVRNLAENLLNLGSALVEFLQNPTKGFNFNFKPILDGFKADADALPEMVKPSWVSMQAEIDKLGADMAEKESKRAANIAKAVPRKPAEADDTAKKKDDPLKLAGAAELGSKEAYKTLSLFSADRGEGRGDDSIKGVAKNGRQQLAEAQKANVSLARIADKLTLGGAAPALFTV